MDPPRPPAMDESSEKYLSLKLLVILFAPVYTWGRRHSSPGSCRMELRDGDSVSLWVPGPTRILPASDQSPPILWCCNTVTPCYPEWRCWIVKTWRLTSYRCRSCLAAGRPVHTAPVCCDALDRWSSGSTGKEEKCYKRLHKFMSVSRAANDRFSYSWRRALLGPSPGWKCLLTLKNRHYSTVSISEIGSPTQRS